MTHDELRVLVQMKIGRYATGDLVLAAQDAIAAISEALKEPTPEMIRANFLLPKRPQSIPDIIKDDWQAMLAASPLYPTKEAAQ